MSAPGGLSDAEFKSGYVEAGDWIWGTTQGAFNEKATVSQIVVDAVIGMIPLLGDVTAARDLIAISMGLINEPQKRDDTLEWVSLVIMLLALIPVFGGVIKGVGRLVVRGVKTAREMKHAGAVIETLGKTAEEIIQFMNRLGIGDARKWFLDLQVLNYLPDVQRNFRTVITGMITAFERIAQRLHWVLPDTLVAKIKGIVAGLRSLLQKGEEMIPKAVKEFHGMLVDMQTYIRTGGSRLAVGIDRSVAPKIAETRGEVVVGNNTALTEEGRLRNMKAAAARSARGGYLQNEARKGSEKAFEDIYKYEKGYPDLFKKIEKGHYTDIEAFSGRIINRDLGSNEGVYRVFGPKGEIFETKIKNTDAQGGWWGVGAPPKNAKEWREPCAVLDEFNHDGFIVEGIMKNPNTEHPVRIASGTTAEQYGTKIPEQYLSGGAPQARIDFPPELMERIRTTADEVMKDGVARTMKDSVTGMEFTIRPTGWKDANGIYGYLKGVTAMTRTNTVPLATSGRITHRIAEQTGEQESTIPQTVEEVYIP